MRLHHRLCRISGSWPKVEEPHSIPCLTLQKLIHSSPALQWRKPRKPRVTFPLLLLITNREDLDHVSLQNLLHKCHARFYIQRTFHFKLSSIDFNVLLQKSFQSININVPINRNHTPMQIQLVFSQFMFNDIAVIKA